MYNKVWRILIHSNTDTIYKAINNIAPPENFTYDISWSAAFDNTDVRMADVIVLDAPFTPVVAEHIATIKRDDAKLIICVDHDSDQAMLQKLSRHLNYVCIKPLTEKSIRYYFSKLEKQLQLEADYTFTKLCLDTLLKTFLEVVWIKDKDGNYIRGNNALYTSSKHDLEVIESKKDVVYKETISFHERKKEMHIRKSPVLNHANEAIGTIGVAHETTETSNVYAKMKQLIESIPLPLVITDEHDIIKKVNQQMLNLLEFQSEQLLGHNMYKIFSEYPVNFAKTTFLGNTLDDIHNILYDDNGKTIHYKVHRQPINNIFNELSGYMYYLEDSTLENEYQEVIFKAANTDVLTRLGNRRNLNQHLAEHLYPEDTTMLRIDIDRFKTLNDLYDHVVGDQFLVSFARFLESHFIGSKLFRIDGDDFIVLLPNSITEEEFKTLSYKITNAFQTELATQYEKANLSMNISIINDKTHF